MIENGGTVAEQLREGLARLSTAERRVARALLAEYPAAGMGSVADLAETAGTSTASAVRMVQKLGYEGFGDFSATLRRELSMRRAGPMELLDRAAPADTADGPLNGLGSALAALAGTVQATVPQAEFDSAVGMLADRSRTVGLLGGRATHVLAAYLGEQLVRLRPGVRVLSRDEHRRRTAILDLTARSVLVAFDFRRHDRGTIEIVRAAAARRARTIVVTDVLLSPAANRADVVLPVVVDAPSPFDTSVVGVVLIECLLHATLQSLGGAGVRRMRAWETLAEPPAVSS